MDRVRASLRSDLRAGAVGWAGVGGAVWLLAGDVVDSHRRGAGRRGAGFRDPVRFHASQRKITRPDGEGGIEHNGGLDRDGGNSRHHGDSARGAGARGGEGVGGKSVGRVHGCRDNSHRDVHGRLHAILAHRQSDGGIGHRCSVAAAGGVGREAGLWE